MNKLKMPQDALQKHQDAWLNSIKDGIDKAISNQYIGGYRAETDAEKTLLNAIKIAVNRILTGCPLTLDVIKNKIGSRAKKKAAGINKDLFDKLLPKIFDYDCFRDGDVIDWTNYGGRKKSKRDHINKSWDAFEYLQLLDINCCPYCNRLYISTVRADNNTKTIKPELDHFFCKSEYPYLAISLYNLIPSCSLCNSRLKGKKQFGLESHLNPFVKSFHRFGKFKTSLRSIDEFNGKPDSFDIELEYDNCLAEGNAKAFYLKDLYKNHKDYVSEIIVKAQAYNPDWLSDDLKAKLGLSGSNALRYYIGNYLDEENINKRPLSKLTIDICKEFGILS